MRASRKQAKAARAWWRDLQPDQERPRPQDRSGDRAALARLRRAATPLEAAEQDTAVTLARILGVGITDFEDVAVCAAVLAHVRRDNDTQPVARFIGVNTNAVNGRPLLTPLRFRRLIEARDASERLTQFRRLADLAGNHLNVADFALAALDWSEYRRREWIFLYHGGEAPHSETQPAGEAS